MYIGIPLYHWFSMTARRSRVSALKLAQGGVLLLPDPPHVLLQLVHLHSLGLELEDFPVSDELRGPAGNPAGELPVLFGG
jgi:hypothetical protein